MTLAAALTAYAEYVGDLLVNECGAPQPSRVLRYHGHAAPDDLDCGSGILSVWWAPQITGSENGPNRPCLGYPQVNLHARWVICWKLAQADQSGITLFDDTWDETAAMLADVAECVSRGLVRLSCPDVLDPGDLGVRLRNLSMGDSLRFQSAAPVGATSDVAGVHWTTAIGLRAGTSS